MLEEHTYKGFGIRIVQDLDAENPRTWGLGTIVSNDALNEADRQDVIALQWRLQLGDDDEKAIRKVFPDMVWFHRVWRYSHGGDVWALHDRFPDGRWDVSWIGFIVVTREDIREWYNRQRMSDKLRERIHKDVARQLEAVTAWSNGNVYGFFVDAPDPDLDGVFYGGYNDTDEALDEAKARIDDLYHELTRAVKYA